MKTNELRIGNWFKRSYQPDGFQIDSHSFVVCERDSKMYKPIKLTEQWLKNFGFIGYDARWQKSYPFYIKWCDWKPEGWWLLRDIDVPIRELKYVHQLQNLYFALTGEELIK